MVLRRGVAFVGTDVERLRFSFQITMASRDRSVLVALKRFLAAGSLRDLAPRRPGLLPVSVLTITSTRLHLQSTIPFAERFLLPCAKRTQFERWRDRLLDYAANRPGRWGKGPSTCSVPGCGGTVRGRGLCRRHYYDATGH